MGRDLHAKRDDAVEPGLRPRRPARDGGGSWACSIAITTRTPPRRPPRPPRRRRWSRRPATGADPRTRTCRPCRATGLAGRQDRRDGPGPPAARCAGDPPPRRMTPCSRPRPPRPPRRRLDPDPATRPAAASSTSSAGTTTTEPPDPARGRFSSPPRAAAFLSRPAGQRESEPPANPAPIDASRARSRDFTGPTAPRIVLHGQATPGPS